MLRPAFRWFLATGPQMQDIHLEVPVMFTQQVPLVIPGLLRMHAPLRCQIHCRPSWVLQVSVGLVFMVPQLLAVP
jgi:hypothetical protein